MSAEWTEGDLKLWPGCDLRLDYRAGVITLATVSRLKPHLQGKKRRDLPFRVGLELPALSREIYPRVRNFATIDAAKLAAERAVAVWMSAAGMVWCDA